MKSRRNVILALAVLAASMLLSPSSQAGGPRHGHRWHGGHGHHHHGGDSFHFGFAFAFPIFSYGYYGYPYGYPYYGYGPVYGERYRAPVPATLPDQTAYNAEREKPEYCREYTKKIIIDGKVETAFGTACLQEDGNWRIMN